MSRLRIVHRTDFRYDSAVGASYNEARMLPASHDSQLVLQSRLRVHPVLSLQEYVDYWGTRVASFDIQQEHTELSLIAESLVEVWHGEHHTHAHDWEVFAAVAHSRTSYVEHLEQSARTAPPEHLRALAWRIRRDAPGPCAAAEDICRAVGERVEYVQGVTGVGATAAEAWTLGKGVCQDITHIALGALRAVGIPARYVSGYLHPSQRPQVGETVTGESHAWVEWFCGNSWRAFDPTNLTDLSDRHVSVGRGRDYDDVAPFRGVYSGSGEATAELSIAVEITRLG